MAEVSEIRELARKLNLMNIANGVIDIDNEIISNKEYLYKILEQEINIRYQNKIKELKNDAHLPKRVFDYSKITKGLEWQLDRIKQFDFKNNIQNIIIVGECSSGKTALAAEIGNAMILKEAKVKYVTIDNLLFIKKAKPRQWSMILKADALIIDEVFYITPTYEELLETYRTLIFLSETRSIVLITNRDLSDWKDMKVDAHLVETLKARLMNDAQLIHLKNNK